MSQLTMSSRASIDHEKGFDRPHAHKADEEQPENADTHCLDGEHHDDFTIDPFKPFDNLPEERSNIMTFRALFVGICCGAVVNASNMYLGLRTGWTFTANIFGTVAGFAILNFFSKVFPEAFLGGSFGPRENNICQTAAMASGGLTPAFLSAWPAMHQLKLLGGPPPLLGASLPESGASWGEDSRKLVCLTAVFAFFGFFVATPMRKFFIVYVARELRMVFPTPSATAITIRSLHQPTAGEAIAKMKMRALSIAFGFAMVLRVVSQYALGILWDWHVFTWFYIWSDYSNSGALAGENWGWYIELTPAFLGAGILVGLNVAVSFLAGSVLAWGIIGPVLVYNHMATGFNLGVGPYGPDPKWEGYATFASLSLVSCSKEHPSPRYWLLWPGVLLLIASSITELALQWRILYSAGKALCRALSLGVYSLSRATGKELEGFKRWGSQAGKDHVEDSAADDEQVKMWMWLPGLILSVICICGVVHRQFDLPVGMSLLSVFLSVFFAFVTTQCMGVTDALPLTAATKASQLILGGATRSDGWDITKSQRTNLIGGAMCSIGASQCAELTSSFRTGFLLRTPPRLQWLAHGLGTLVGVLIAPAVFQLFAHAYPCIIDGNAIVCEFALPSVSAWRATAVALTDPTLPIPTSSGIFAIIFGIFGSLMVLVRHFLWVGDWAFMKKYHPNMMCIGLAFVTANTQFGTAMTIGAALAAVWRKKKPEHFDVYAYAVAAGLIAGEGVGGVVNAAFKLVGISGYTYGSNVGCPMNCEHTLF